MGKRWAIPVAVLVSGIYALVLLESKYSVLPIATGVSLVIFGYVSKPLISNLIIAAFLILAFFIPGLTFMIPALMAVVGVKENKYDIFVILISIIIPFIVNGYVDSSVNTVLIGILCFLLGRSERESIKLYGALDKQIVETRFSERKLTEKSEQILRAKDNEIRDALATERMHISRDIHDNVGHLLSRAILQLGALIVTEKTAERKEMMEELKETLTESMDSMRRSLHNLQSDVLDIESEIEKRAGKFDFCELKWDYDIYREFTLSEKYSLLSIIDEALNNIIKHSNATEVVMSLRENDQGVYILIRDNGVGAKVGKFGMGLKSIETRVSEMGGKVKFSTEKGFHIFINIP